MVGCAVIRRRCHPRQFLTAADACLFIAFEHACNFQWQRRAGSGWIRRSGSIPRGKQSAVPPHRNGGPRHAYPPEPSIGLTCPLRLEVIRPRRILVALQTPRGRARTPRERGKEPQTHRQLHPRAAILNRRGAGGEGLQRTVEKHRMQRVFAGAAGDCLGQGHAARRVAGPGGELADRAELLAVAQAQIAHVAVEAFDFHRLRAGCRRRFPRRGSERRFGALAAHRAHDMQRPRGALIKAALDRKRALVGVVGDFEMHTRGRVGQNERFADFKVLDDDRRPSNNCTPLHDEVHEARPGKMCAATL